MFLFLSLYFFTFYLTVEYKGGEVVTYGLLNVDHHSRRRPLELPSSYG